MWLKRGVEILKKLTLDDYLASKGLRSPISDYMLDKLVNPHGLTLRQRKKLERDNMKVANDYADRRYSAEREYWELVEKGEIVIPTQIETLIRTAHGHEDNTATQAARRVLAKRGIDWQTTTIE